MSPEPYEVASSRFVLENLFLKVREDAVVSQGMSGLHYVVELPRAATIVPVLDDGTIVFIRQYRHSIGRVILELPGGRVEPGEAPDAAARRELREEAGFEAAHLVPLGSFFPVAGISDHEGFLFEARGLQPAERRLDFLEDIEVILMSPKDLQRALDSGAIVDAFCLVALFRFFLRNPRAKSDWNPL
jgi:ADP-ribose pyrophosphatase